MTIRVAVFLLYCVLTACKPYYQVASQRARTYQIQPANEVPAENKLAALIEPYQVRLADHIADTIGWADHPLTKQRPESTLGNALADLLISHLRARSSHHIDFATLNHGGVRLPELPAGPLRVEQIYELMPFDNKLVVLPLPTPILRQLLHRIAETGGWPVSNGLRFTIDDRKATRILVGGQPLLNDHIYHVALPDYIANGGDRCTFLTEIEPVGQDFGLVRDALIAQLKSDLMRGESLSAIVEGRIVIKTDGE